MPHQDLTIARNADSHPGRSRVIEVRLQLGSTNRDPEGSQIENTVPLFPSV